MRVLITGGAGFVGRAFTRRLVDDGHKVVVVDDLSAGLVRARWPFPPKDRYDFYLLIAELREWLRKSAPAYDGWDLVIHCAAVVGGRLKIDGDPLKVATDLAIDSELFNWIVRRKPMPKLIYFSSSAAYPIELQTERMECNLSEGLLSWDGNRFGRPDQTYGFSKFAGEFLAQTAAKQYGLDVKIYRPFGGYGADQSYDYPFPSIIRRVLQREDPVIVWGSGNQQRDFIHIDDIVEGVMASYNELKPGEVLNLGSGIGTSFRELALRAGKLLGYDIRVENDATKPEGVFRRVADTWKMRQFYEPKVSLDEGIMRVAEYLKTTLDKAPAPV